MARVLLLPRQLGHGFPAPLVIFTPWVCSCCCLSRGSAATKTQPRGCLPLAALFCHSLEEPLRPHPSRGSSVPLRSVSVPGPHIL